MEALAPEHRQAGPKGKGTRIPGHYIVVLNDSVKHPGAVANDQIEEQGGSLGFVYGSAIKGYSAKLSKAAVEALRSDPRVEYVEPDQKFETTSQTLPTGIQRIRANENVVADIDNQNDAPVDVDVAVIDTGIDYTHPDLNVVVRTDCGEEAETVTCVNNSGNDTVGHGTHVAGTIGAIDNGTGVVGVAPGARLWAVKVFGDSAFTSESNVIAGVNWVKSHAGEIEAANLSLGCVCAQTALDEAISEAVKAGVVFTVAAGNEIIDAKYVTPASNPDVITVSALADYDGLPGAKAKALRNGGQDACTEPDQEYNYGEDDVLAWFSNQGEPVDVAAPGVCILSTLPNGDYGFASGTSMAAPHVAGVAALLASESNPSDGEDVEAIRQQIIDQGSQNWNDLYLWNSLDLSQVGPWWVDDEVQEPLLSAVPPDTSTYSTRASRISLTSATLNGGINPGGEETDYQFEYGTSASYGKIVPLSPVSVGSGVKDLKVSQSITGLKPDTTYHYRLSSIGAGTIHGEDRVFTTSPAVITLPVSGIVRRGVLLNGSLNPLGAETDYYFEWGETTEYGNAAPVSPRSIGSGTSFIEVEERIEGLEPNTKYHYRLVSTSNEGNSFGRDVEFTTGASAFVADEYPASLSTKGQGGWFTELLFRGSEFYCSSLGFESELVGPSEALEIEPQSPKLCETWGSQELTPEINGCHFVFYPGDPLTAGTFALGSTDIKCPEGKAIVVPGTPLNQCKIEIHSQKGLPLLTRSSDRLEIFLYTPDELEYSQSGEDCDTQGTFKDGYIWGGWVAAGTNAKGDPISVEIVNSPATLEIKTATASNITQNTATLRGSINPEGSLTSYHFEWGKTTEYGGKAPISPESIGSGISTVSVEDEISGLMGSTVYHYRVVAENARGTSYGKDRSLTTAKGPKAIIEAPSSVTDSEATLNGKVNPEGSATSYYFEYGKTTSYGTKAPVSPAPVGSGAADVSVSQKLTGLSPDTTYHYRVAIESASGTVYGEGKALTTTKTPPKATTEAATNVKANSATLNAKINPEGIATSYYFEIGNATSYNGKVPISPKSAGSGTSVVAVSEVVSGLLPGTTYHFRIVAEGGTVVWGEDKAVTSLNAPKATTEAATNVKAGSATLNGKVNPEGSATSYYFEYGKTTSYGTKVPVSPKSAGSGTSAVSVYEEISGLEADATYHYRLVAEGATTVQGADKTLTTLKPPPKVTTEAASSIKPTKATLNGKVNPEGSATSYYFEYGKTTSYGTKVPTSAKSIGSGTSNVSVSQIPTGLTKNETYHYRLVASSEAGTTYGEDKKFIATENVWTIGGVEIPEGLTVGEEYEGYFNWVTWAGGNSYPVYLCKVKITIRAQNENGIQRAWVENFDRPLEKCFGSSVWGYQYCVVKSMTNNFSSGWDIALNESDQLVLTSPSGYVEIHDQFVYPTCPAAEKIAQWNNGGLKLNPTVDKDGTITQIEMTGATNQAIVNYTFGPLTRVNSYQYALGVDLY